MRIVGRGEKASFLRRLSNRLKAGRGARKAPERIPMFDNLPQINPKQLAAMQRRFDASPDAIIQAWIAPGVVITFTRRSLACLIALMAVSRKEVA